MIEGVVIITDNLCVFVWYMWIAPIAYHVQCKSTHV